MRFIRITIRIIAYIIILIFFLFLLVLADIDITTSFSDLTDILYDIGKIILALIIIANIYEGIFSSRRWKHLRKKKNNKTD